MKTLHVIGVCMAAVVTTTASAGRYEWTSGWAQGVTEYLVDDGNKNELNISCPDSGDPISAYATIGGVTYSSDEGRGFDVVVDGEVHQNPFFTDCRVCSANFPSFWAALRKANNIKIVAAGKTAVIPTRNVGKVLHPLSSKKNNCKTAQ